MCVVEITKSNLLEFIWREFLVLYFEEDKMKLGTLAKKNMGVLLTVLFLSFLTAGNAEAASYPHVFFLRGRII